MEIRNDKRTIITGRTVCTVAGLLAAVCGIYWIVKAFTSDGDDMNLPAMLGSICCAVYLTAFAGRRRR